MTSYTIQFQRASSTVTQERRLSILEKVAQTRGISAIALARELNLDSVNLMDTLVYQNCHGHYNGNGQHIVREGEYVQKARDLAKRIGERFYVSA